MLFAEVDVSVKFWPATIVVFWSTHASFSFVELTSEPTTPIPTSPPLVFLALVVAFVFEILEIETFCPAVSNDEAM